MNSNDRSFWRAQEARRHTTSAQACCTQSTIAAALMRMRGDLAVVIHGERDCLNSFHLHTGRNLHRLFSTRLREAQLVMGACDEILRQLLFSIAGEVRPAVVFVLGTCPVQMVASSFDSVVEDVSSATGVPMVALRTHGLAHARQEDVQDWLFATLAGLAPAATDGERAGRINLIGLPNDDPEPSDILEQAGLNLNGRYDYYASLEQWRSIQRASASCIVGAEDLPQLAARLAEMGQEIVRLSSPYGIEHSLLFYRRIGAACGRTAELERILEPRVAECRAQIDAATDRCRGVRFGLGARMTNTSKTEVVSHAGLASIPLLRELGFDVRLLVQGPTEKRGAAQIEGWLAERGWQDLPHRLFPGPWALPDLLRDEEIQICRLPDHARPVAAEAGVTVAEPSALRPFLSGVGATIATLLALVRDRS